MLQLANRVAYSPAQPIGSIPCVIAWLGQDIVRALLATTALVEQLREWPERHELVAVLIVSSLYAAVYGTEIEAAMQVPPRAGLFSAASLYLWGDIAIAYLAPPLWHALSDAVLREHETGAEGREETGSLGVSKRQVVVALAEHWKLLADFGHLLGTALTLLSSRWRTESEAFYGLVVGSNLLIDALGTDSDPARVAGIARQIQARSGIEPMVLPSDWRAPWRRRDNSFDRPACRTPSAGRPLIKEQRFVPSCGILIGGDRDHRAEPFLLSRRRPCRSVLLTRSGNFNARWNRRRISIRGSLHPLWS
jgi:hypothetical protein